MEERDIIRQGGVAIGYFDGDNAVLDGDFIGCEIGRRLTRSGCPMSWQPGVAKMLEQDAAGQPKLRSVRVHQLKPGTDPGKKFIGYAQLYLRYGGIDPEDYQVVFDGRLDTDDPEELYERFSTAKLPKGYRGHRLTISDVVERYSETGSEFWYLDLEGFLPIDMMKEEHL